MMGSREGKDILYPSPGRPLSARGIWMVVGCFRVFFVCICICIWVPALSDRVNQGRALYVEVVSTNPGEVGDRRTTNLLFYISDPQKAYFASFFSLFSLLYMHAHHPWCSNGLPVPFRMHMVRWMHSPCCCVSGLSYLR